MSINIMYDVLPKIAASGLEIIMPDSLDHAINLSSAAFLNDPLYIAAAPDIEERKKLCKSLSALLIRYGMRFGIAYKTSGSFDGFAVWLPPGEESISMIKAISIGALHLLFRIKFETLRRLTALDRIEKLIHSKDSVRPYWYLLELAVTPDKQGQGVASKLMKPFLQILDETKEAAYLETHNQNNVGLYRHYGFELLSDYGIPHLPGLHHFSMFRPAQI